MDRLVPKPKEVSVPIPSNAFAYIRPDWSDSKNLWLLSVALYGDHVYHTTMQILDVNRMIYDTNNPIKGRPKNLPIERIQFPTFEELQAKELTFVPKYVEWPTTYPDYGSFLVIVSTRNDTRPLNYQEKIALVRVGGKWNVAIEIMDYESRLVFVQCKDKGFSVKDIPIEQIDPTHDEMKKHLPPEAQNVPLSHWWDEFTESCNPNFPVHITRAFPNAP
jgi:hypothetical protein